MQMTVNNNKEYCPLCGRELIDGPSVDYHHLIPRSKGGKNTIKMHKVCHRKIHKVFTEKELKREYFTIEKILENKNIQKFLGWIRKKHPEFCDSHK